MKFHVGQRVLHIGTGSRSFAFWGTIIDIDDMLPNILIKLEGTNHERWVFEEHLRLPTLDDLMELIK